MSAATARAIAELERTRLHPGAIAYAVEVWSRFAHGPARLLDGHEPADCPCGYEPQLEYRRILRLALHALPTRAARELRAVVRPLDELYLSRATPEPSTAVIRDVLR